MSIGDAIFNAFLVLIGLGLALVAVILLVKIGRAAITVVIVLIGLAFVLALYQDAIHGWPILSRLAWLFYQMIQQIYASADQATSGVPQLTP